MPCSSGKRHSQALVTPSPARRNSACERPAVLSISSCRSSHSTRKRPVWASCCGSSTRNSADRCAKTEGSRSQCARDRCRPQRLTGMDQRRDSRAPVYQPSHGAGSSEEDLWEIEGWLTHRPAPSRAPGTLLDDVAFFDLVECLKSQHGLHGVKVGSRRKRRRMHSGAEGLEVRQHGL